MRIPPTGLWPWVVLATVTVPIAAQDDNNVTTIVKDVAVVGGGASGSYSAVRLREDYNVSVILIEKEANLVSPRC